MALISILLAGLTLAATPAHAATPFVLETVDATGHVGESTSLALDARGSLHVSYYDYDKGDLKYAVKTGGSWAIETVDATGLVGRYTSIALDAGGNPQVIYYDDSNYDLKYAVKTEGVWAIETVDAAGSVGQWGSLALDADGNPHVSYYDGNSNGLKYAAKTGGSWTFEAVDGPYAGTHTSLALDAQGNPHVSYYASSDYDLKYAVKVGGSWSIEIVDAPGIVGGYTSLALDGKGIPHVSYYDFSNANLKYAVKSGGSWSIETVDATGYVGGFTSLALDTQGNAHVSYNGADGLKYAVETGGSWALEIVDAAGNGGSNTSLVLDNQGNPHVSYYDNTNQDLKVADAGIHLMSPVGGETWTSAGQAIVTWQGLGTIDIDASPDGGATYTTVLSGVSGGSAIVDVPGWTTTTARVRITRASPFATSASPEVFAIELEKVAGWWQTKVDTVGDVGTGASLALDTRGIPHLGYYDETNADLKYAMRTGGIWTIETVDATGDVGWYNSLALDAQGNPHVSYFDFDNQDLKYAVKTGGSWSIETVDATGNVGFQTSLAVDVEGNPHISYYSITNADLKYAEKTGGSWAIETVDATGVVGYSSSLALDAGGVPHVSYYDVTNFDLKYAAKTGGIWTTETVDATGDMGAATSLTLDADGNPHVCYYDNTNDDLKYAVKTGGSWKIGTVDASGDVGQSTSLALDGQGNPHVGYYDNTNGNLKYASAAVEVATPAGGDAWPVGAVRAITWDGVGTVDVSLSVDGGLTYGPLASGVSGGRYDILVPHTPSRFCRIKLERRAEDNTFGTWCYPLSTAESDSFFTIETSVELLMMMAAPSAEGPGLVVTWKTDPGPEDLDGYRLERRHAGEASWLRIAMTKETRYHDAGGVAGDRYRLFAVNGLGDEFYLGEAGGDRTPSLGGKVVAYPVPFQSGEITILFENVTASGRPVETEVAVYDVSGRRVRTVSVGRFSNTTGRVTWDGRDAAGSLVASGVYFVRVQNEYRRSIAKIIIVR